MPVRPSLTAIRMSRAAGDVGVLRGDVDVVEEAGVLEAVLLIFIRTVSKTSPGPERRVRAG